MRSPSGACPTSEHLTGAGPEWRVGVHAGRGALGHGRVVDRHSTFGWNPARRSLPGFERPDQAPGSAATCAPWVAARRGPSVTSSTDATRRASRWATSSPGGAGAGRSGPTRRLGLAPEVADGGREHGQACWSADRTGSRSRRRASASSGAAAAIVALAGGEVLALVTTRLGPRSPAARARSQSRSRRVRHAVVTVVLMSARCSSSVPASRVERLQEAGRPRSRPPRWSPRPPGGRHPGRGARASS